MEMQLQAKKAVWNDSENVPWADWLPLIQCMNYDFIIPMPESCSF